MIKKLFFFFTFLLGCIPFQAQIISGKVLNSGSLKPVDNVAIITNLKTGTISNSSGIYQLNLKNIKTITFSCLGYQSITINVDKLKQQKFIISLSEKINLLDEIRLNLSKKSLDSILMKSEKSMKENYISDATKQGFYAYEKQNMSFKKLELDLKSSTLMSRKKRKLAKQELAEFSNQLVNQNPEFTEEFYGEIASKKITSKKTKKLLSVSNINNISGYKKNDIGNGLTLKKVEQELQNIVLKHLKDDKIYKLKTGLFKIEDSLSLKEVTRKNDSIKKDNSFSQFMLTNYKSEAENKGLFVQKQNQNNFYNQKYYKHKLEKDEFLGSNLFYVVSFKPRKSKAKFSGKMYINPTDFTIKKISYKYAKGKRGEHINLKWVLGIKYSENENETVLFYEKNEEGKIYTSYYKNSFKNYAYLNRPIKFIENSADKEKVKFNIKVEVIVSENKEFLANNIASVSEKSIKNYTKEDYKKRSKYITKEKYLTSNWKNKKLIIEYLEKYQ